MLGGPLGVDLGNFAGGRWPYALPCGCFDTPVSLCWGVLGVCLRQLHLLLLQQRHDEGDQGKDGKNMDEAADDFETKPGCEPKD